MQFQDLKLNNNLPKLYPIRNTPMQSDTYNFKVIGDSSFQNKPINYSTPLHNPQLPVTFSPENSATLGTNQ